MTKTASNRSISQWLFNPFRFVAGYKALLLGLAIILLSGFIGWLGNTHFDGVLDVHLYIGTKAALWYFLAEGIIDWLSIAIGLFFFGLIVSPSTFRMVDVFGTQVLARWPYLITVVVIMPEANRRVNTYLTARFGLTAGSVTINYTDILIFAFAIIVGLIMAVWMVALMYRAYAVSCNVKGAKAIVTFVVSLVGAEVLSKFSILLLYGEQFGLTQIK